MLLAVVWRVVVAVPLRYVFLVLLYSLFSRHRAQLLLYYLTFDMCLRFRGCPVVLDSELSVTARHQKTRVLLAVRAASCAAACYSSSERRCAAQISKLRAMRVKQNNEFGPIRSHQKITIFGAPLLRNCVYHTIVPLHPLHERHYFRLLWFLW